MREIVVTSYCDRCAGDGAREPATETFTVGIAPGERPGRPHLIELCERHGKELYELTALVVEHGMPTEKLAPAERTTRAIPSVCPVPDCGRELPTRKALSDHLRHTHKTTLGAVTPGSTARQNKPATCTVCGFVAASGTGLSAHTRVAHPTPEEEPEPEPEPEPAPESLTTVQAAKQTGVSRDVIVGCVRRGTLRHTRTADGNIRIAPADLAEWLANREPPTQEVLPDAH
jgi:excisionase family DNA binding protein